MVYLAHQLITDAAQRTPEAPALLFKQSRVSYRSIDDAVARFSHGLIDLGLTMGGRVAVYLPKRFETVVAFFGTMAAGGVMVPVNPYLKPAQIEHILTDCEVEVLVTSRQRLAHLCDLLTNMPLLRSVVVVDEAGDTSVDEAAACPVHCRDWASMLMDEGRPGRLRIDSDVAAILYTSGSTGKPKGVILSHRNLVAGAQSVASYLENSPDDRLLAVLPFSFDYGFSQLTTAFSVGASVVLMDYLLPRDVIDAVARKGVTGLAAVPPLWNQLAALNWPDAAVQNLRYLTNSGGVMRPEVTRRLRDKLPNTDIFLMYGLTEAFRSTYLRPELVTERPDSIGQAIPNADVQVVRPDGSACDPGEPGELVHRGALVAMGYWNDPAETARRFRPAPGQPTGLPQPESAVWSGDTVYRDIDGFLYFVGRDDEMIKTSGYRVSPSEIETVAFDINGVEQAVAIGVDHPELGQVIVLIVEAAEGQLDEAALMMHCRHVLPSFMVPARIVAASDLPRGENGKIDRQLVARQYGQAYDVMSQE
jgi:acyl-CoA ligase (AMP-forming) (exosortase A-associated)